MPLDGMLTVPGTLTWGGDYTMPFQPDRLRVHPYVRAPKRN